MLVLATCLLVGQCLEGAACKCTGVRSADPQCCWEGHAFDPGALEPTPMRGWRSWNAFASEIDQQIMEDTMRGLAKKRFMGGSRAASLADAGYIDVGLDAGYEMKGQGYGGSCHTKSGHMLINESRFPSFNNMTDTAHMLGLTASWYLNADPCPGAKEKAVGPTYDTDAADVFKYGFDGVKFDSQAGGPSHNITLWAMALDKAAKDQGKEGGILIENCLDKDPKYLIDDPSDCPYHHYRSGPDNSPSFFGGLWHVWNWAVPFLNVSDPVPASRPNCFAYPDILGIGSPVKGTDAYEQALSRGCANMTLDEERTLFANWAIVSSPLVLGFDARDDSVVEKYWPIVTNQMALNINNAWVGSPGTLLKQSDKATNRSTPDGTACELNRYSMVPDWLVYAKPLPGGAVACLVINSGEVPLTTDTSASVTLSELLSVSTLRGSPSVFEAEDVWTGRELQAVDAANEWSVAGLSAHNSSFVVFTPKPATR